MRRVSPPRDSRSKRRSLGVEYVGLILAFIVITGITLGAAVTLTSVRNAVDERSRSIGYAARVVAASVLPVVADQDTQRIEAQLAGILAMSDLHEIQCIELEDSAGVVIAETDPECTCDQVEPATGLLTVFTEPQVVRVPIEVEGLQVATLSIQFRPTGLEQALIRPVATTFMVLGVVMIVSALWGGWAVLRLVVEPIEDIQAAASRIAEGERDIQLSEVRSDEIGALASALNDMAAQLELQEQELLGSYRSLEAAFHDKAELAQQLERTMGLKSDFVATASHEIRSPLAVIRLYAEMLGDNEFGEIDAELGEAVESIAGAAARLSSIVSSLLDMAMLERGLMSLEYADIDVCAVVEQAVADARHNARSSGVAVAFETSCESANLYADEVRLRQVVDNLLSNAIKYSPDPGEVRVTVDASDEHVRVRVTDQGPGIPPDRADVLFELFGRADSEDNARIPGLGLGLAISERIVKAHGGQITFEPGAGGVGTTFTVCLPLDSTEGEQPPFVSVM